MSRLRRVLAEQGGGTMLGLGAYFYDPIFLEIAAKLGFRIAWFDLEHCLITFSQAADLCRIASGLGLLTMVRIPDTRRENVLKAAECGPDIIDVPMANSPEVLHELVRHARFRPEGERGSFSSSRGSQYGLPASYAEEQQRINRDLCLMGQVETVEAVERADELCAVPGVDIFIGPLDLSASLGVLGQTVHPKVMDACEKTIRSARKHGKLVAVAAPAADSSFWIKRADVFFCTNDISCLKAGAQAALRQAREVMAQSGQSCDPVGSPRS